MGEQGLVFGGEVRRLRTEAGLTLDQLAKKVHYSKGHLSKIETGMKQPPIEMARRLDAALGADGALAALVVRREPGPRGPSRPPLDRRGMLAVSAAGAATLFGGLAWARRDGQPGSATCEEPTTVFADLDGAPAQQELLVSHLLFDQLRTLGHIGSPAMVMSLAADQARVLCEHARHAVAGTRKQLLLLASRFAEYAGWMAQEAGDAGAAMRLTAQAVELAALAGDPHLAAYGLVRQALVALYQGAAADTVDLAQTAQADRAAPARTRGLAAQREAQGHALAGDRNACLRSLERCAQLLAGPDGEAAWGGTSVADHAGMAAGWCAYDLGRPEEAAELLREHVAALPATALRSRARYGARLALAYAGAGGVAESCALADEIIPAARAVDSATVRTDLRKLARTLSRWPANPAVREVSPRLVAVAALG